MGHRKPAITATAVFVFTLFGLSAAGSVLCSAVDGKALSVAATTEVLIDPDGTMPFSEVRRPHAAGRFTPNRSGMVVMESAPAVTWVRFTLSGTGVKGSSTRPCNDLVLEIGLAEIDTATLYLPVSSGEGAYRIIHSCRSACRTDDHLRFRNDTFRIDPDTHGDANIYLRLESFGYNATPLFLWQAHAFHAYARIDFLLFGLSYGIIVCMVLYNLFICITLRNSAYLAYVLYMVTILGYFFTINGHVNYFTSLNGPMLQTIEFIFLGLFMSFSISFCKRFCDTKTRTPRLHWIAVFFQFMGLAILILGVVRAYEWAGLLSMISGALGPINLIWIGWAAWRKGYDPARYFIVANISLVVGITAYVFWTMGILPFAYPMNLVFTLGPAVESILLSFALADRIKLLEKEKMLLARSAERYKKASEVDPLTGLFNRGYLVRCLEEEMASAIITRKPLSCVIMDVDDFKRYNDTWGHPEGDGVLKSLAGIIKTEIREHDAGCRYGGEEFMVIFVNSTAEDAKGAAERIRTTFAENRFCPEEGTFVSVTISMGLAQFIPGEAFTDFIQRADQALYRAKKQGKNQVVIA